MPEGDPSPPTGADPPSPERDARPTPRHSPGAGCLILVIALLSLSFLVGFGIWNLFKQDKELAKFTEKDPRPTPVPDLVQNAPDVNRLNAKIETFTTDAGNGREASLILTPSEINLAIAAFDAFDELREKFTVQSIEDGTMKIAISFPLRGSPTKKDEFRYLNGTMVATPELASGEVYLVTREVLVPGKTVPEGFINSAPFSPYRIAAPYVEDETLGPWMKRLTALALVDGTLVLTIAPDETPSSSRSPTIKRAHLIRAAVLFGLVILAFAGFMLYAAKRTRQMPRED